MGRDVTHHVTGHSARHVTYHMTCHMTYHMVWSHDMLCYCRLVFKEQMHQLLYGFFLVVLLLSTASLFYGKVGGCG